MPDTKTLQAFSDWLAQKHKQEQTNVAVLLEQFIKESTPAGKLYTSKYKFCKFRAIQIARDNIREIKRFLENSSIIEFTIDVKNNPHIKGIYPEIYSPYDVDIKLRTFSVEILAYEKSWLVKDSHGNVATMCDAMFKELFTEITE